MEYDDPRQQELYDDILEAIQGLNDGDLIELYNRVSTEQVYEMSEFNDFVEENKFTPIDVVEMVSPTFNTDNNYFTINLANEFISFDYFSSVIGSLNFDEDEVAREVMEEGNTYGISDLRYVLERYGRY